MTDITEIMVRSTVDELCGPPEPLIQWEEDHDMDTLRALNLCDNMPFIDLLRGTLLD